MIWSKWTGGPEANNPGEVFVSVTHFQAVRMIDMPRIALSGLALQRRWEELPGAVGVWLWLDLTRKRTGSVSVWRTESDMHNFVRWAPHVEIVRRNRRAGRMTSTSWTLAKLDRRAIRTDAASWLSNWNEAPSH